LSKLANIIQTGGCKLTFPPILAEFNLKELGGIEKEEKGQGAGSKGDSIADGDSTPTVACSTRTT
jgi:hypothetical protein